MPAHVKIADKFEVTHRRFDWPVAIVCRDDGVIELYSVVEGMEQYAGKLDWHSRLTREERDLLVGDVARHVEEDPVSLRALAWLHALHQGGLL